MQCQSFKEDILVLQGYVNSRGQLLQFVNNKNDEKLIW